MAPTADSIEGMKDDRLNLKAFWLSQTLPLMQYPHRKLKLMRSRT